MKLKISWNRIAQVLVVLGGAYLLKRFYSTASADQLRWILAPTTTLVELVGGASFEFESHAGYLSRERGFLIANSCAGVNFLITAFLMLSFKTLLSDRSKHVSWGVLPVAALAAYLVTLLANATRISLALWLRQMPMRTEWLNPAQLHRFEGIVIYFGFLLLLFALSEKLSSEKASGLVRRPFFPLAVYYAMALGVPFLNHAYRQESEFWAHSLFVFLLPLLLILPLAAFRVYRRT